VRQQVADGHLAGDVGVVQLEGGHVLRHRVVPADLAFVHQHGERGGGERLGVGRDAEKRLGGDRRRLALLAHAVALGQYDLAVLDDGHRDAGDIEFLAGALHYLIDILLCRT
jgi:hypothetical protein